MCVLYFLNLLVFDRPCGIRRCCPCICERVDFILYRLVHLPWGSIGIELPSFLQSWHAGSKRTTYALEVAYGVRDVAEGVVLIYAKLLCPFVLKMLLVHAWSGTHQQLNNMRAISIRFDFATSECSSCSWLYTHRVCRNGCGILNCVGRALFFCCVHFFIEISPGFRCGLVGEKRYSCWALWHRVFCLFSGLVWWGTSHVALCDAKGKVGLSRIESLFSAAKSNI